MNEKQNSEFAYVVKQCEDGQYRSINVASKIRSDAIVAAWCELNSLRAALRDLVKFADQEQNTSTILFLGAMAQAREILGNVVE